VARELIEREVNMSDRLAREDFGRVIAPLRDAYEVTLRPIDPRRSNQANRYYWKVVIGTLQDYLNGQGQHYTKDECHDLLGEDLRKVEVHDKRTGAVLGYTLQSTAGMTGPQFHDYVQKCLAHMADFGIFPTPPMNGELDGLLAPDEPAAAEADDPAAGDDDGGCADEPDESQAAADPLSDDATFKAELARALHEAKVDRASMLRFCTDRCREFGVERLSDLPVDRRHMVIDAVRRPFETPPLTRATVRPEETPWAADDARE
jgi:hypothetical protein